MDTVLDQLDIKQKIPLSVPFIARYLSAGRNQSEIARIAGKTKQAVSSYISTHYEELEPLLDKTDGSLAFKAKRIADLAMENISKALTDLPQKDARKLLIPLNAISGTHIEKFRLLEGKSTEIHENRDLIVSLQSNIERFLEADKAAEIDVTPTNTVKDIDTPEEEL